MAALAAAAAVVALALAATPAPSAATTDTSSTSTLTRLILVTKTSVTNGAEHTAHRYVSEDEAASLTSSGWEVESLEGVSAWYVPTYSDTLVYEYCREVADGVYSYRYSTATSIDGWTKTGYSFYGADSDNAGRVAWYALSRYNTYTGTYEWLYTCSENEIATRTNAEQSDGIAFTVSSSPAFYTLGSVKVTTTAGTGGSVSPSGTSTLYLSGTLSCTVTASTGYTISSVLVNGTALSGVSGTTSYTHTFQGILYSSSGASCDQTLSATFTPNTYSVVFHRNTSSSDTTTKTQSMTYDTSSALTSNTWTRTGYTFAGWATSSSSTTVAYTDGQSVKNLTSTSGGTVDLYAVWVANTYTISFDSNEDQIPSDYDAENMPSSVSATYDETTTLPSTEPTRHGYTFEGWNTAADGSGTTYEAGSQVLNLTSTNGATVTLYAQWEPVICVSVPTVVACVVMYDGEVVVPSGYQIENLSVVDVVTTADGMVASDVSEDTVTHLSLTDDDSEVFNTTDGTITSFSIENESSIGLTWSVEDLDGTLNEDLLTAATQGAAEVCTVTFTFEYAG